MVSFKTDRYSIDISGTAQKGFLADIYNETFNVIFTVFGLNVKAIIKLKVDWLL